MDRVFRAAAGLVAGAVAFVPAISSLHAQEAVLVRRVQVIANRNPLEIEIEGSDRLTPKAQVLTGPDRLVVDFVGAAPAVGLRNQTLNRGDVKGVRVGLLSAKPPVTRVVFDLKWPQPYQIFPSGRTVIVKMGGAGVVAKAEPSGARLVNTNFPVQSVQITPPEPPPLVVSFKGGVLTIDANKANLAEVLFAVHQRTGAEIAIPAGAEQEKVFGLLGPASAPEVLSRLLNGSKFNFLIVSSANDPNIMDRVILSAKPEGPAPAYHPPVAGRVQEQQEEVENTTPPAAPPITQADAPPTAPDHPVVSPADSKASGENEPPQ
jgi:hypothetical protein